MFRTAEPGKTRNMKKLIVIATSTVAQENATRLTMKSVRRNRGLRGSPRRQLRPVHRRKALRREVVEDPLRRLDEAVPVRRPRIQTLVVREDDVRAVLERELLH